MVFPATGISARKMVFESDSVMNSDVPSGPP